TPCCRRARRQSSNRSSLQPRVSAIAWYGRAHSGMPCWYWLSTRRLNSSSDTLQPRCMCAAAEEDAARAGRRQAADAFQAVGVPYLDFIAVAHGKPELVAAGGEFHVQYRGPRFERGHDPQGFGVDDLHQVVVRV